MMKPLPQLLPKRVTNRFLARRPEWTHSQHGMALVESLISILIFSFGVLGLLGLEARAINFSVDSEDRNRASMFASEIASSMWLAGNVNPSAANVAAWQVSVADPTKTGLTNGTVAIVPVAGTTNAADITITWKPPARAITDANSVLTTRVILP
jgi:type IV pilus assembly protein PilV